MAHDDDVNGRRCVGRTATNIEVQPDGRKSPLVVVVPPTLAAVPTIAPVTAISTITATTTLPAVVCPRPETTATSATAPTASVPASSASTAVATSATAATAAESTGGARSTRLCLVHHERTALKVKTVQRSDRGLSRLFRAHGDEPESSASPSLPIGANEDLKYFPVLRENVTEPGIGSAVVQVANVDLEHERTFPARRPGDGAMRRGDLCGRLETRCPERTKCTRGLQLNRAGSAPGMKAGCSGRSDQSAYSPPTRREMTSVSPSASPCAGPAPRIRREPVSGLLGSSVRNSPPDHETPLRLREERRADQPMEKPAASGEPEALGRRDERASLPGIASDCGSPDPGHRLTGTSEDRTVRFGRASAAVKRTSPSSSWPR
jgi:hypothetical protein